jgi:hypothetical protein
VDADTGCGARCGVVVLMLDPDRSPILFNWKLRLAYLLLAAGVGASFALTGGFPLVPAVGMFTCLALLRITLEARRACDTRRSAPRPDRGMKHVMPKSLSSWRRRIFYLTSAVVEGVAIALPQGVPSPRWSASVSSSQRSGFGCKPCCHRRAVLECRAVW